MEQDGGRRKLGTSFDAAKPREEKRSGGTARLVQLESVSYFHVGVREMAVAVVPLDEDGTWAAVVHVCGPAGRFSDDTTGRIAFSLELE